MMKQCNLSNIACKSPFLCRGWPNMQHQDRDGFTQSMAAICGASMCCMLQHLHSQAKDSKAYIVFLDCRVLEKVLQGGLSV